MTNPIHEIKKAQINLAAKIREDHDSWDSVKFRHQHIAYCELRGRTRDQIEVPREDNKPDQDWIDRLKKEWSTKIDAWRVENGKE